MGHNIVVSQLAETRFLEFCKELHICCNNISENPDVELIWTPTVGDNSIPDK